MPLPQEILTTIDLQLLEILPIEPNGLSVWELAEEICGNCGPVARATVKSALDRIRIILGHLHIRRGDDFLGHADVALIGLRRRDRGRVVRIIRERQT